MANDKISEMRVFGSEWIKQSDNKTSLIGCYCNDCNTYWFPSRKVCANCFGEGLTEKLLSDIGEVYSYSKLHVASKGFETPLTIAYIDFPEGVRVCGQVEGEIEVGSKVHVTFGKIRTDSDKVPVFSYKFKTLTQWR
jgi:uncharacterized protein